MQFNASDKQEPTIEKNKKEIFALEMAKKSTN